MKRVKIMLTAVAILAIVSGALASKVKNLHNFYYSTDGSSVCTILTSLRSTTTATGTNTFNYTTVSGGDCTTAITLKSDL